MNASRVVAFFVTVALCAVACAEPTTHPAAAARSSATTRASFPTPSELAKKIRQSARERDARPKVAYFDLSEPITERPADFSLFGQASGTTLHSLLQRMREASEDADVRAVLITLGDSGLNLSQAQEIRDSIAALSKAGKKTYVYSDSYDTTAYTVASAADHICLLPGGEVLLPGVGIETMFAKGLLDKVGVKADSIQIGEYKGAEEQFTRTTPSPELAGEFNRLMDSLYAQLIDGIVTHRHLDADTVKGLIDQALLTATAAKEKKLVDDLVDVDGLRELISNDVANGQRINLISDYGREKREQLDLSSPFAFFQLLARKPKESTKPSVALIYAEGMIVDGRAEGGLLGSNGVGSDDLRRAFRLADRDSSVKAVVLRIDSPGGSAVASEAMWQAARRLSDDKPLIVSVGSMAASGGYYLASAGDHIIADPSGIVGSIGVVGGKFVLSGLFDKIGITTESFRRGANADLFSSSQPFDAQQREMVTAWMKDTYGIFTQRVMTTRRGKIKDIDKVARGRIFAAQAAKDLGMVDEIGGLESAITYAANEVELKPDDYEVKVLPAPKTLADLFSGAASEEDTLFPYKPQTTAVPGISAELTVLLAALPPSTRAAVQRQFEVLQLLEQRPILLVSPYAVTVH